MTNEEKKEYFKKYRENNREKLLKYEEEYRKKNKAKIKEKDKQYNLTNKDKKKLANKIYREKNKAKIKEKDKIRNKIYREKNKDYVSKRYKTDPVFKITHTIRKNILKGLKTNNYIKKNKTIEILGCSFNDFKTYIESKFESWMTWDNHGKFNGELNFGWDLDHIIPLSTAKTEEDIIRLNHYTNFQPLCSYTNRYIKKDRVGFDDLQNI